MRKIGVTMMLLKDEDEKDWSDNEGLLENEKDWSDN